VRDFVGLERISCSERVHRSRKKEIQLIRSQIQKKKCHKGSTGQYKAQEREGRFCNSRQRGMKG
jgi:hypothetical protein